MDFHFIHPDVTIRGIPQGGKAFPLEALLGIPVFLVSRVGVKPGHPTQSMPAGKPTFTAHMPIQLGFLSTWVSFERLFASFYPFHKPRGWTCFSSCSVRASWNANTQRTRGYAVKTSFQLGNFWTAVCFQRLCFPAYLRWAAKRGAQPQQLKPPLRFSGMCRPYGGQNW